MDRQAGQQYKRGNNIAQQLGTSGSETKKGGKRREGIMEWFISLLPCQSHNEKFTMFKDFHDDQKTGDG